MIIDDNKNTVDCPKKKTQTEQNEKKTRNNPYSTILIMSTTIKMFTLYIVCYPSLKIKFTIVLLLYILYTLMHNNQLSLSPIIEDVA